MVTKADSIAIGKIVEVAGGNGQFDKRTVTVAIDRMLKGDNPGRVTFQSWDGLDSLDKRKEQGRQLLFFLYRDPLFTRIFQLYDPDLRCLAEFQTLRDQKEVLPAIERIVREHRGLPPPETVKLAATHDPEGQMWQGIHSANLEVPVDARLEKWAREQLKSNEDMDVEQALQVIRRFGPEGNAPLVLPLLKSPMGVGNASARTPGPGYEQRELMVRTSAYDVLTHWGIKADRPARWETVETFDTDDSVIWQWPFRDDYLQRLTRFKRLRALVFFHARGLTTQQLAGIGRLKSLRNLTINDTDGMNDGTLGALAGLRNLENLDLGYTRITDASVQALARYPHLKTLCVDKTGVTTAGLEEFKRLRPKVEIVSRPAGPNPQPAGRAL